MDVVRWDAAGDGFDRNPLSDQLGATGSAINAYRLSPGERFADGLHAHMDQEEVFVVITGEAAFQTLEGAVHVAAGERSGSPVGSSMPVSTMERSRWSRSPSAYRAIPRTSGSSSGVRRVRRTRFASSLREPRRRSCVRTVDTRRPPGRVPRVPPRPCVSRSTTSWLRSSCTRTAAQPTINRLDSRNRIDDGLHGRSRGC